MYARLSPCSESCFENLVLTSFYILSCISRGWKRVPGFTPPPPPLPPDGARSAVPVIESLPNYQHMALRVASDKQLKDVTGNVRGCLYFKLSAYGSAFAI
jgi:hypothetical protein